MPKRRPTAAAALLLCAAAFAAENVALDNFEVTLGPTSWRAPHVEVTGSTLPQAELAQLFSGEAAAIDARLEKFSASRARIPSLSSETRAGTDTERTTLRDLSVEKIESGRLGVWRSSGGETTVEEPAGAQSHFVWGPTTTKGLDLRQAVRLALVTRGADEALKPLIDEDVVDSARMEDKEQRLTVTTGRLAMSGVKARPLAFPWQSFFERLDKSSVEKADPTLIRDLLDLLNSFEVATLEARDIEATGKGEPRDKPYSFKIGRIGANRLAGAGVGDVAIEKLAMAASDGGELNIGSFAMRDVALTPWMKDGAFPRLAHIVAENVTGDLPDSKTSATSRVIFRFEKAEANFENFVENTPSKFSASIGHASTDLKARGETESTAHFLALGYDMLDFSAQGSGEWFEKSREATIGPIGFDGRDMGSARLTLALSNVTSAVFSSMPIVAKAAALAMSLTSFDLTIEGGELVNRMVALEAKERKTTPEKARAEYARAAGDAVTALAGGGEKAKTIGAAVSAYILDPARLHVKLTAPKGVSAIDALAKKPGEIIESAEVEAVAER